MEYTVIELDKENYDYHELHYVYDSHEHYKVEMNENSESFSFNFVRESLEKIYHHDSYDILFSESFDDITAFGIKRNDTGEIIAYLEISREEWNDRLRITNLLVKENYRGLGFGSLLVNKAKEIAQAEDRRVILLETQSCNIPAIDFYKKHGFVFAGTNLYFYSNIDVEEDEVMIEMVYLY